MKMKSILQLPAVALCTAVLLSLLLSVFAYTPAAERLLHTFYESFSGLLILHLVYTVPVMIVGGMPISFLSHWAARKSGAYGKSRYMLELGIHAAGGLLIGSALLMIDSAAEGHAGSLLIGRVLAVCLAGALLFYHVALLFRRGDQAAQ